MRRALYIWLGLVLLCGAQAAERLRLASGDWPPYAGRQLPYEGSASRIIRAALAEQGIVVEFVYLSWPRGLEMARRGHLDGTILWTPTPERAVDFLFSDPVLYSEVMLLYRQDSPLYGKPPRAPQGYQIGLPHGYNYGEIPLLQTLLQQSGRPAVKIADDGQGIKALVQERIDLYPIDRHVGRWLLTKLGKPAEVVQALEPPLRTEPLSVLLYRHKAGASSLQAALNAGLEKLRSSGQLEAWLHEADTAVGP
jgi:polar amino acid transport system substrate-binding protein